MVTLFTDTQGIMVFVDFVLSSHSLFELFFGRVTIRSMIEYRCNLCGPTKANDNTRNAIFQRIPMVWEVECLWIH